jgi:hypothetical protein
MRDCLVRDQRDRRERERLLRGVYTYTYEDRIMKPPNTV